MRKRSCFLLAAAAALVSCHGGRPVGQINPLHVAHNYMTDHLLTVNMGALRHSNQWGSASMGDASHGLDVSVKVENEPRGVSETAYIGHGNCIRPATREWKPLHAVVNGASKSHVAGVTVGEIKKGHYSIVVDGGSGKNPISCGDFEL